MTSSRLSTQLPDWEHRRLEGLYLRPPEKPYLPTFLLCSYASGSQVPYPPKAPSFKISPWLTSSIQTKFGGTAAKVMTWFVPTPGPPESGCIGAGSTVEVWKPASPAKHAGELSSPEFRDPRIAELLAVIIAALPR